MHTHRSPYFTKYADRIAKALGKSAASESEKEEIFAGLVDVDVMVNRGTYPKLGNWFMWNQLRTRRLSVDVRWRCTAHIFPNF